MDNQTIHTHSQVEGEYWIAERGRGKGEYKGRPQGENEEQVYQALYCFHLSGLGAFTYKVVMFVVSSWKTTLHFCCY